MDEAVQSPCSLKTLLPVFHLIPKLLIQSRERATKITKSLVKGGLVRNVDRFSAGI